LAGELGFTHLDTGAMYRALALKAIENDIDITDETALGRLAERSEIKLERMSGSTRVILDSIDVSQRIRERDVTEAASQVSTHPAVRRWMVARQHAMGATGGVVMEGRDIGTHVFPDAEVKIFLDAAETTRGVRRKLQVGEAPAAPSQEEILQEIRERDERDRSRAASPLRPAADAIVLDTTELSFEQVVARALEIVKAAIGSRSAHPSPTS
jgi:cytidylate kinase